MMPSRATLCISVSSWTRSLTWVAWEVEAKCPTLVELPDKEETQRWLLPPMPPCKISGSYVR
jgi:hypothetical protein